MNDEQYMRAYCKKDIELTLAMFKLLEPPHRTWWQRVIDWIRRR